MDTVHKENIKGAVANNSLSILTDSKMSNAQKYDNYPRLEADTVSDCRHKKEVKRVKRFNKLG